MQSAEHKEYLSKINQLKQSKKEVKTKNNIKGTVIVENEDEDEDDSEDQSGSDDDDRGAFKAGNSKVNEIFKETITDFKQKQKEEAQKQKEKEVAALAKIEMMKVEKSKNKVISSVGKGLVSNNLSSKLETIKQNKGQIKTGMPEIAISAGPASGAPKDEINQPVANENAMRQNNKPQLQINRRKIYIKGTQIGCLDFYASAKKYNIEKANEYTLKKYGKIFIKIEDRKVNYEEIKAPSQPQANTKANESIENKAKSQIKGVSSLVMQSAKEVKRDLGKPISSVQNIINKDSQKPEQEPEAANEELSKWMQINKIRENEIQQKLENQNEDEDVKVKLIRYIDAWMYFMTENYTDYLDDLERDNGSSGGILSMFKKKAKLNKSLEEERDVFLCLAKVKMDTSIEEHERVLFSIYMNLTGEEN